MIEDGRPTTESVGVFFGNGGSGGVEKLELFEEEPADEFNIVPGIVVVVVFGIGIGSGASVDRPTLTSPEVEKLKKENGFSFLAPTDASFVLPLLVMLLLSSLSSSSSNIILSYVAFVSFPFLSSVFVLIFFSLEEEEIE